MRKMKKKKIKLVDVEKAAFTEKFIAVNTYF